MRGMLQRGDSGGGPNWFTATEAIPYTRTSPSVARVKYVFLHFCGVGGYKMGTERDPLMSVGQLGRMEAFRFSDSLSRARK